MMITDHIAFGMLISDLKRGKLFVTVSVFVVICTIIPDIPAYIFPPGTPWFFLHRTYTHSVFLSFAYCLLPVGIWQLIKRRYNRKEFLVIYIFSIAGFLSHILLDLITTYGIKMFYPLSEKNYALDLFHEFDPVFLAITLSVIIVFVVSVRKKEHLPVKWLWIFAALFMTYFSYTLIAKEKSSGSFEQILKSRDPGIRYQCTVPRTFWRWKGIAAGRDSLYVIRRQGGETEIKPYFRRINPPPEIAGDTYFKAFISYARFPAELRHGDTISYINLVYSSDSYRVTFVTDGNGRILSKKISGFDLLDKNL